MTTGTRTYKDVNPGEAAQTKDVNPGEAAETTNYEIAGNPEAQDLLYRRIERENPYDSAAIHLSQAINNLINRPNDVYSSPQFKKELLRNLDVLSSSSNINSALNGAPSKLAAAIRNGEDLSSKKNLELINAINEFADQVVWEELIEEWR